MYDVGSSLRDAINDAQSRLARAQNAIAQANAGGNAGRSADAAMAETAQAAIFSEALLSIERSRFAAIKEVAK